MTEGLDGQVSSISTQHNEVTRHKNLAGWLTRKCNVLEILRNENVLGSNAIRLLKIALGSGGYVSGGFATMFGNFILGLGGVTGSDLEEYLDYVFPTSAPWDPGDQSRGIKTSDIDVFFRSESDVNEAMTAIAVSGTWVKGGPSPKEYGYTFLSSGRGVQLVRGLVGEPIDVLSTFDIANAKSYFDLSGFHFTPTWLRLEDRRQIGIDGSSTAEFPQLFRRWVKKHSYTSMRVDDEEAWVDSIERVALKTRESSREAGDQVEKILYVMNVPTEILRLSVCLDEDRRRDAFQRLAEVMQEG